MDNFTRGRLIGRRGLFRATAVGSMALAAGIALPACDVLRGNLKTVTDMGGREVAIPENILRVFCSNPIGTVDLYALDPDLLVGWNFRPVGDNRSFIPEVYLNLPTLGVWMGAGATPSGEEIVRQDPDVIFCYWTADSVGRKMADEIRDETGVPVLLVDYDVRSSAEMFRYVGRLCSREERAEELASYCEEKIADIAEIVASVPSSQRKSVYIAQGVGGLSTDPVGSMHVTDALELIGTRNVADLPGTEGQGMGMPTVNLEQVVEWNPDAVLVSEYSMSDTESSDVYGEIMSDSRWQVVPCVAGDQVFRMPQSPFAWFGRPPSVMRLLGCLLLLSVLYPDQAASIDLIAETREFYRLFLRIELDDDEAGEIIATVGA